MSFDTTVPRNDYVGNGAVDTYKYDFRIFAYADLEVTVRDTANVEYALVYLTDFTATDVNNPNGGNVTITKASLLTGGFLTTGYALTIRFNRATQQSTDLRNQGSFNLATIEDTFDQTVRMIQQNEDVVNRSLHLPETEVGTAAKTTLPVAATRASKFLAFNASGEPIASSGAPAGVVPVSTFMETVLDDTSAAAARTTLGSTTVGDAVFTAASAAAAASAMSVLPLAGGTMTGDITMTAASLFQAEGAAVASAATTDIWAVSDGDTVHITGTTTITSLGTAPQAGCWKKIVFDGALTLTHGANVFINNGAGNITTAANDWAFVYADTTTQMDVLFFKASGQANVAGTTITDGTACVMNPFAINTKVTTAHGLGVVPYDIDFYAECLTAELGYSVGDRINFVHVESGGAGAHWKKDATNVTILAGGAVLRAVNFTTPAGSVALTPANWKVVGAPSKKV